MHIKFISRGKGSASAAKEYLLQKHDHNGEIRADVQVLRGNPEHVTLLADSLEFKHRYTSGVIAWHKDDAPTDEQIAKVLDDFERVAFAGLEPNQYTYYAVLHEESNGAKHIHVVAPRVELSTGKSLNIAPPNWQKTYDVLVDKYNTKHNWASPKDLHRRKLINNRVQLHSDMSHTKAKTEVNKAVQELVAKGTIKNEEGVTKYLNSIDGVTVKPRRSKKNLSIEVDGIKKSIRLEGLAYGQGFDVGELRQELRAEQESRARETTADRTREYERVSGVLEGIISDRARFNQGRYTKSTEVRELQEQHTSRERREERHADTRELSEREPRANEAKNQAMDNTNNNGISHSPSPSTGELSPSPVHQFRTSSPQRHREADTRVKEDQRQVRDKELGQRNRREERADNVERPREWTLDSSVREKQLREHYDAIRERIKSNLEHTRGDVLQRAKERNHDLRTAFVGRDSIVQDAIKQSHGSHQTAERNIEKVREHINELADNHRRGADAKVNEQSQQLTLKTEEVGRGRHGLNRAVQYCIEKVIELAQKIEQSYSRSFRMKF